MGEHAPQEVPEKFSDLHPPPGYYEDYAIMNGMASLADEVSELVSECECVCRWVSE